jgi:hypothetical protein
MWEPWFPDRVPAPLRPLRLHLADLLDLREKETFRSVAKKIVELELREEELDDQILGQEQQIEAAKTKVVSARSLTEHLTTFADLYQKAQPEERRELMQLRVNQLIWTSDEIRLALIDRRPETTVSAVQRELTVGSPKKWDTRTRS